MPVEVRVTKLGADVTTVRVEDGDAVHVALTAAGVDPTGQEIQVNGQKATLETPVHNADTVIAAGKVRGG